MINRNYLKITCASLVTQMVKNLPAIRRPRFSPWVRKIPWRREWLPTPVFSPGEFHRQRSLAGCSPRGRKELDTHEWLTLSLLTAFLHSLDLINMSNKCQMSIYLKIFIRSFSFFSELSCPWASLIAQLVKNPPAMWETWVLSLG